MVKGAFLEPGEITICFSPLALQIAIRLRAKGILGYFICDIKSLQ